MPKTPRKRRSAGSPYPASSVKKVRRSLASALTKAAAMMPRSGLSGNVYNVLRSSNPFPASKRVSLKYVECTFNDIVNLGAIPALQYRANGCYDPNIATVDTRQHQPYGWDQWVAIYDQYRVMGSTIKVTFATTRKDSTTGPGDKATMCGITLADDSQLSWSNLSHLNETRDSRSAMMGADFRPVTVRHRYNSRTYFAGKQLDALQASTAADPSEQAVYYVWVQEATGAPNSDYRVAIRVEIVYDVVFSELKKLGQS